MSVLANIIALAKLIIASLQRDAKATVREAGKKNEIEMADGRTANERGCNGVICH